MHQDWTTQNSAVTGGTPGLGRAISLRFVHSRARVFGLDVNGAALRKCKQPQARDILPYLRYLSWTQVATALGAFTDLDVPINGAGATGQTNLKSDETDPVDVERVPPVNFFGCCLTSKAA